MGSSLDPYDVYAYRGVTVPYSAPPHLAVCSYWSGGPTPCIDRFSLVELGSGDGGNLLPLAFYHPKCRFVGIDCSRSALDRAHAAANVLGLENISLVLSDIRDVSSSEFGRFDYVVAHGLYSWVPDDARSAILRFCRDVLAPDGLAYVSYNAQPGWSTRQVVRDTLRRSRCVRDADVPEKAAKAIAVAARLLEDLSASRFASTMVLADELVRVRDGRPYYVFHEYLTETNDGFWLRDFVDRACDSGLAYLVDAHFCRWEGYVPPELRKPVAERRLDPLDEEETLDLMGHRYFRASILARSDARRTPVLRHEFIAQRYIASSLRPQQDPLDLDEGTAAQFVGAGSLEITLDSSIVKAAAVLLGRQWPRGIRLDELYEQCVSLLGRYDRRVSTDCRTELLEGIKILFEVGQVDLRYQEPMYSGEVVESPTAHALARWEAAGRDALTTPHHHSVAFDADTMSLVRSMDGSRSRAELREMFGAEFVEETLPILGRFGLLTHPHSP